MIPPIRRNKEEAKSSELPPKQKLIAVVEAVLLRAACESGTVRMPSRVEPVRDNPWQSLFEGQRPKVEAEPWKDKFEQPLMKARRLYREAKALQSGDPKKAESKCKEALQALDDASGDSEKFLWLSFCEIFMASLPGILGGEKAKRIENALSALLSAIQSMSQPQAVDEGASLGFSPDFCLRYGNAHLKLYRLTDRLDYLTKAEKYFRMVAESVNDWENPKCRQAYFALGICQFFFIQKRGIPLHVQLNDKQPDFTLRNLLLIKLHLRKAVEDFEVGQTFHQDAILFWAQSLFYLGYLERSGERLEAAINLLKRQENPSRSMISLQGVCLFDLAFCKRGDDKLNLDLAREALELLAADHEAHLPTQLYRADCALQIAMVTGKEEDVERAKQYKKQVVAFNRGNIFVGLHLINFQIWNGLKTNDRKLCEQARKNCGSLLKNFSNDLRYGSICERIRNHLECRETLENPPPLYKESLNPDVVNKAIVLSIDVPSSSYIGLYYFVELFDSFNYDLDLEINGLNQGQLGMII